MKEPSPNPSEIDKQAKEYLDLKDKVLNAKLAYSELQQQLELKGETLRDLVTKFGSSHAEKSKLIHGLEYEAMCSYGQTSYVDAAAVENFRQALADARQARLINKIFEKTIRWTLKAEASVVLRRSDLSNKLQALWAKCIVLQDRTPSLTVRAKEKSA